MISNNSLSAFSAATTIAPPQAPQQPRLVREQIAPTGASSAATKNTLPVQRPTLSPPRGTLLNLSV